LEGNAGFLGASGFEAEADFNAGDGLREAERAPMGPCPQAQQEIAPALAGGLKSTETACSFF